MFHKQMLEILVHSLMRSKHRFRLKIMTIFNVSIDKLDKTC